MKRIQSLLRLTVPKKLAYFLIAFGAVVGMTAAVTQIDLTQNVKGVLPKANGGAGADMSSVTFPSSGTLMITTTSVQASQLPNPGASSLGGVQAKDCSATGHLQKINTDGTVTCSADSGAVNFADQETPTGLINSSNTSYSLAHTPSPAASLTCFENGVAQRAGGADFTLAAATMTYVAAPSTGSTLVCNYRY